jgi:hypothetical protein
VSSPSLMLRSFVKATEIIEELERQVAEFGDGECQLPDPLENWWYPVDRVEREPGENVYRLIADR